MYGLDEKLLKEITIEVIRRVKEYENDMYIPIGISNHHIHLSKEDLEVLFGKGYKLTKLKNLKQPGQFVAKETVDIIGPKSTMEKVRVLGPIRDKTQLEISITDGYLLGVLPPVRESGKIEDTPSVIIKGPKGLLKKDNGVIAALRHIHMPTMYAQKYGFRDRQMVSVLIDGVRKTVYHNVLIRVSDKYVLELHIDTDEANAACVKCGDKAIILRD